MQNITTYPRKTVGAERVRERETGSEAFHA